MTDALDALDDLTFDHEDDGVLVRKQLDRVILAQGAWATVMFLFQELDRETGAYRAPKMAIVRFKKWRGAYRKQSSFNVANEQQARQITQVFEGWYPKIDAANTSLEPQAEDDDADDGGADEHSDELGAEG
jgi:hypothetical protein